MNDDLKIGFIGGGNMASAIIGGLREGGMDASRIHVIEPDAARGAALATRFGVTVAAASDSALLGCDVIVLAVKPQQMREALAPLSGRLSSQLMLSIAAGLRVADLSRWLGGHAAIVRAMPNTPSLIGAGMTGLYAADAVDAVGRDTAAGLMAAVGEVMWVADESGIDAITAIAGSGPAYVFHFIEALERAACKVGFEATDARRLALATVHGAARLAASSEDSPATLRERVTSRGGTTAAALRVFAEGGFVDLVERAAEASRRRAAELGDELGGDAK